MWFTRIRKQLYQNGTVIFQTTRQLSLQEYQCKKLLSDFKIHVQRFMVVKKPEDLGCIKSDLKVREYVIKAQIPAGGRGKGRFSDGFVGGVHLTSDYKVMENICLRMLGNHLITKQTPLTGMLVNSVMIAEALDIKRETYFAILMDRSAGSPLIVACKDGGMEIEDLAVRNPESIFRQPINWNLGVTDQQASDVASILGFVKGTPLHEDVCLQIKQLYKMFIALDCVQVEINPLGETADGKVVCIDAKLEFDQNAAYRQPEIREMAEEVQTLEVAAAGPQSTVAAEAEASRIGINYIGLQDGNIGCIVNGAGLAMATMDLIHFHGGKPANFLDLGGGVTVKQVDQAFRLLTMDPRVSCILVNVFGGIVSCKTVAEGLIKAFKQNQIKIPVVIRLEGNQSHEARAYLDESGLDLIAVNSLDEAARLVVSKSV